MPLKGGLFIQTAKNRDFFSTFATVLGVVTPYL